MPSFVEDVGDLRVGMVLTQCVDLCHHFRRCLTNPPHRRRQRQAQRPGSTAAEADAHHDLFPPGKGNVLDQQPHHALALAVRGLGIVPQPRNVGRQGEDPLSLLSAELPMILLSASLEFFLRVLQATQLLVPLRFQHICHQAVAGIDVHEPASRHVGFVARPLDLLLT